MIKATPTGVEVTIRVLPRAHRTEMAGTRGEAFLIRLAAPPVEGAANEALVQWLARTLDVPRGAVRIVSGQRARNKRVAIGGASVDDLKRLLKI